MANATLNAMAKKVLVLLSSGLDSTVNLFAAAQSFEVALALTFNYGQRAAQREIAQSAQLAAQLKIPHKVIDLLWFRDFGASSLIQTELNVPTTKVQIDDLSASQETAKSVWVPNRNGIFLNIAAGFAESLGADFVIPGFNVEEAATFPDNSTEYMKTLDKCLWYSTANHVRVHCLTDHLDKTEIVKLAVQLKVPFEKLWPCYFAYNKWCGECESCQRAKRALLANGIDTAELFLQNQ